jgi:hypothetical protein
VTITADGKTHGPSLPRGYRWHPMTQRWCGHLRHSPQASLVSDLDWDYCVDTAVLHSEYWRSNGAEHAAELRLRLAKVGATPEDRARLHWKVDEPKPSSARGPSPYGHLRPLAEVTDPPS